MHQLPVATVRHMENIHHRPSTSAISTTAVQPSSQSQPKTPPPPTPMTPPSTTPPPTDDGEVLLKIDTRAMPPALRKDLEANAHLQRTTPPGLLAKLLTRHLAPYGITLSQIPLLHHFTTPHESLPHPLRLHPPRHPRLQR